MTLAVRNHIHLSDSLGGTPEFAPNLKWPVADRRERPEVFQSVKRSLTGVLFNHVLSDVNGPLQFRNWRFVIVVRDYDGDTVWERAEILKGLNGKQVYFVDNYHTQDGATHAGDVLTMVLAHLGEFPQFNPDLIRFYVECELVDAFSVPAP